MEHCSKQKLSLGTMRNDIVSPAFVVFIPSQFTDIYTLLR